MRVFGRYKRELAIGAAVVITVIGLGIFLLPQAKNSGPKASLSDLFGGNNRTSLGSAGADVTDSQIAAYQDKLKKAADPENYAKLGLAYLQKAREVGDPTYYTKAEGVFKKSLELSPENVEALGGLGSLSLSRHQFAEGLTWGQKAQKLRPATSYNYGVMADALVELGRYDEAAQVVQQMVDLRPDLSSYSRISYLRELRGQYDGAVQAMKQASMAGGPTSENRAYIIYQLGNLYFNHNDLTQAAASYQEAISIFPGYVYAQAGMARIKAANNDFDGAINLYTQVTQRMPLPEFIIELGDLYTATNRADDAKKQYDLVRGIQQIYRENGVDTDLEMALFDADHNFNLPDALAHAKQVYAVRPSIKAADVLAWTHYKSGDYASAAEYSQQALRLGTQDSLMLFHAGMIKAKQGNNSEARAFLEKALNLNPNFSLLYANEARKTLAGL